MSQQTYIPPRGPSSQQTTILHGVSHSSSGREIQHAAAAQYPGDTSMDVLQVEPSIGLVYRNSPEQRAQVREYTLRHERTPYDHNIARLDRFDQKIQELDQEMQQLDQRMQQQKQDLQRLQKWEVEDKQRELVHLTIFLESEAIYCLIQAYNDDNFYEGISSLLPEEHNRLRVLRKDYRMSYFHPDFTVFGEDLVQLFIPWAPSSEEDSALKEKLLGYFSEDEIDLLNFLCQVAHQQPPIPVSGCSNLMHPKVSASFTYNHLKYLLDSTEHGDQLLATVSTMLAKDPTDIGQGPIFVDGCEKEIEWLKGQIQALQS